MSNSKSAIYLYFKDKQNRLYFTFTNKQTDYVKEDELFCLFSTGIRELAEALHMDVNFVYKDKEDKFFFSGAVWDGKANYKDKQDSYLVASTNDKLPLITGIVK